MGVNCDSIMLTFGMGQCIFETNHLQVSHKVLRFAQIDQIIF